MTGYSSANLIGTDTIISIPSANVKGSVFADSVTNHNTPECLISYYDSATYNKSDSISYTASVFSNHELKPHNSSSLPIHYDSTNWIFFLLVIITILYLYMQVNFSSRYSQIKRAFIVKRYYSQMVRDGNIFKERIIIPIYGVNILLFSLLIYCLFDFYIDFTLFSISHLDAFLIITICVLIYQILQSSVIRLVGSLFYAKNESETYLLNQVLFSSLYSLFLLPTLWLYTYNNQSIVLIAVLLFYLFLFSWRFVKAVIIWKKVFTSFKLFLYLCTLEILPFVIIAKAILLGMKRLNV
jgi:hypothetical protein